MIHSNKEGNYGAAIRKRNLAIKFRIEIIETRTFDSKYNIILIFLLSFYYLSNSNRGKITRFEEMA